MIDVDSVPDTQDASSSDQPSAKASAIYSTWDVTRTEAMRDKTHRGAWCNPCLKHGVQQEPQGQFFANIEAILAHVKDCPRRNAAIKNTAAAQLKVLRDNKRAKRGPLAGLKRTASNMSGGSTEVSSGSNKRSALAAAGFMSLEDKPLGDTQQTEWEQQLLRGTISANIPLSSWDDTEFRKCFTDVRPKIDIPSRKVMSTRILDLGAQRGREQMKTLVAQSDGELLCMLFSTCCLGLGWLS